MAGTGSGRSGRLTLYLLVLNLLVLALGIGGEYLVANRVPVLEELNAGKIRFWTQPDDYKPKSVAAKPVEAVVEPVQEVLTPVEAVAEPSVESGICLDIAELTQARYQELRTILKSAGLAGGECLYSFEKKLGWWVFWPPEYEAAQRDKAIKAVQAAGVKDFLPIGQGAMAQSFSLGVFSSEAQANRYRDALRGKGLAKVDYGPRPSMESARLGCLAVDPAKLGRLKVALPAWTKPVAESRCPAVGEPGTTKPRPR